MDIYTGQPMSDIHTWIYPWIYPWISISTATLTCSLTVSNYKLLTSNNWNTWPEGCDDFTPWWAKKTSLGVDYTWRMHTTMSYDCNSLLLTGKLTCLTTDPNTITAHYDDERIDYAEKKNFKKLNTESQTPDKWTLVQSHDAQYCQIDQHLIFCHCLI